MCTGDGVWVGNALSIENPLIELLTNKGDSIKGLTLVGSGGSGQDDIFDPKYSGFLRIVSIRNLCHSTSQEDGWTAPSDEDFCQKICKLFGINTVALRMSPPDAEGYCSVEHDAANLIGTICEAKGIKRRIAMLDMSLPTASSADPEARVSIKDFDFICNYKCKETADSSIA